LADKLRNSLGVYLKKEINDFALILYFLNGGLYQKNILLLFYICYYFMKWF